MNVTEQEFPGLHVLYRGIKETEGREALERGVKWLERGGKLDSESIDFPEVGL